MLHSLKTDSSKSVDRFGNPDTLAGTMTSLWEGTITSSVEKKTMPVWSLVTVVVAIVVIDPEAVLPVTEISAAPNLTLTLTMCFCKKSMPTSILTWRCSKTQNYRVNDWLSRWKFNSAKPRTLWCSPQTHTIADKCDGIIWADGVTCFSRWSLMALISARASKRPSSLTSHLNFHQMFVQFWCECHDWFFRIVAVICFANLIRT